jgi:hypothetical protein
MVSKLGFGGGGAVGRTSIGFDHRGGQGHGGWPSGGQRCRGVVRRRGDERRWTGLVGQLGVGRERST